MQLDVRLIGQAFRSEGHFYLFLFKQRLVVMPPCCRSAFRWTYFSNRECYRYLRLVPMPTRIGATCDCMFPIKSRHSALLMKVWYCVRGPLYHRPAMISHLSIGFSPVLDAARWHRQWHHHFIAAQSWARVAINVGSACISFVLVVHVRPAPL